MRRERDRRRDSLPEMLPCVLSKRSRVCCQNDGDVTVQSDHHRCVENFEQIMGAPQDEDTRTVSARDEINVKRRHRDLVASRFLFRAWIGELLNLLSRGLFHESW